MNVNISRTKEFSFHSKKSDINKLEDENMK